MFELSVTAEPDGVIVVGPIGEVDMSTAPRLRQELVRLAVDATQPPRLVLDLAGVDLLDTTGIAAILEGVKRCALRDGALHLARPEPQVQRELNLTRVAEALPVHSTVAAAVVAVRASDRDRIDPT